jgi:hypothetical protein
MLAQSAFASVYSASHLSTEVGSNPAFQSKDLNLPPQNVLQKPAVVRRLSFEKLPSNVRIDHIRL